MPFDPSSLQNSMTCACWDLFGAVIVNPNQPFESGLAIISNRPFFLDELEPLAFEQPHKFVEFYPLANLCEGATAF